MPQRLTRLIVSLLVWLVVLSFGMHLLLGWVGNQSGAVRRHVAHSRPLRSVVIFMVAVPFGVGLLVRLVRATDPRIARERQARDRAVRQRVRRPAEGVPPVEGRAEVLDDPDPAIGGEERG